MSSQSSAFTDLTDEHLDSQIIMSSCTYPAVTETRLDIFSDRLESELFLVSNDLRLDEVIDAWIHFKELLDLLI